MIIFGLNNKMSLLQQITTDLVSAMKSKDELKLSTLRLTKTALDRFEKDQKKVLDPVSEQKILSTLVKQRKDSIAMFTTGNRPELAAKEQAELNIIENYMPKEATELEVDTAIQLAICNFKAVPGLRDTKKSFGDIMKRTQSLLESRGKRSDGKTLSEKIKVQLENISS